MMAGHHNIKLHTADISEVLSKYLMISKMDYNLILCVNINVKKLFYHYFYIKEH